MPLDNNTRSDSPWTHFGSLLDEHRVKTPSRLPATPGPTASPNTVQLERDGGDEGWSVGLRPEGVVGAFDVPFDVFAFDDAWVGSVPSGWVESVGKSSDCLEPEPVSCVRGENRPAGRSMHG